MRLRFLKKGDLVIAFAVLLLIAVSFFAVFFLKKGGKTITVKQNNATVYEGKLSEDREVKLKGNTLIIKNGNAYMKCADCKNQICVLTGKISNVGESIVCLPNKVIAEIE